MFKECCSKDKPCGVGQGDCDHDDECVGDLKCGNNNCVGFPSPKADCCEQISLQQQDKVLKFQSSGMLPRFNNFSDFQIMQDHVFAMIVDYD